MSFYGFPPRSTLTRLFPPPLRFSPDPCRTVTILDGGDGAGDYVNLSQFSDAHRSAPSMSELYGTNAYFIMANNRRQAARLHRASEGDS